MSCARVSSFVRVLEAQLTSYPVSCASGYAVSTCPVFVYSVVYITCLYVRTQVCSLRRSQCGAICLRPTDPHLAGRVPAAATSGEQSPHSQPCMQRSPPPPPPFHPLPALPRRSGRLSPAVISLSHVGRRGSGAAGRRRRSALLGGRIPSSRH